VGSVSRASPIQTGMRNCTRDEGGPFEAGSQVLASSHRKLLSPKEITNHPAVTTVNVNVASKVSGFEGRARNRRAKAAWGAGI
jgi:hypothetical protein